MSLYTWASAFFVLFACKLLHSYYKTCRLRKIMPPGPHGLPLLGNVLQFRGAQWIKCTEWKERYGPIFSLNLAGQPTIVLNDFTTVGDLLDRRSNIYSNRPRFIMASEILTGSLSIGLLQYGTMWRRMRRAAHEAFSGHVSAVYEPLQEKESALLALHLLEDPEDWDHHLRRSAASTMLCAVYGWLSIDASADSIVQRINDFMRRTLQACLPGQFLVDVFPAMVYLPAWMAKWKREGLEWYRRDAILFQGLLDDVRRKIKQGTSEPCFVEMLIENNEKYGFNEKEAGFLAGSMFGAGSETTAGALAVFVLAMVLHPDAMHKAQAQIDQVVGRSRLPAFSDRAHLPYVEALVKEVHRWKTLGPLGLPRFTTQDDWYKGYFIPKDTLVILNVWAMHRDPKYFPDHDVFRPGRFLDDAGQLTDIIPDTHGQGHMAFGSGRRVCVGRDIANQALFMDIATILWAFNVEKMTDANCLPVTPSDDYILDGGVLARPRPFRCSITPRSSDVPSIIRLVTDTVVIGKMH